MGTKQTLPRIEKLPRKLEGCLKKPILPMEEVTGIVLFHILEKWNENRRIT